MKAIWKGSISFGLVSIPVNLYSAVQEHVLGFKLLCDTCKNPISYERWCRHCNKEVTWEHVVKGLKLENGSWFIITSEKIKQLKPEKTDTIDIKEFVKADQLEILYYENHYYVGPQKEGEKSFFLFQQALLDSNKVAVGTFVMRDKEYVTAITPYQNIMLLTTLNYAYEIRDAAKIVDTKKIPKLSSSELKLAQELIGKLTAKTFKLTEYKDTFAQRLKEAIKKGKKIEIPKRKPRKKEETLMEALRASIGKPRAEAPVARAAAKKKPGLKAIQPSPRLRRTRIK